MTVPTYLNGAGLVTNSNGTPRSDRTVAQVLINAVHSIGGRNTSLRSKCTSFND
jgi:hypothetical protein